MRRFVNYLVVFHSLCFLSSDAFTSSSTTGSSSYPKGWKHRDIYASTTTRRAPLDLSLASASTSDNNTNETPTKTVIKKVVAKKVKKKVSKIVKKTLWDHAWVPNGERRETVKELIIEMQNEHLKTLRLYDRREYDDESIQSPDWSTDVKPFLEDGMDIIVQWAQLGEGKRAALLATALLARCPTHNSAYYDLHVKIHRRVLHAYYNQFQRMTWNGRTKRPRYPVRDPKRAREMLAVAEERLQTMEALSREYLQKAPAMPLLYTTDYAPLLMGYNQVGGRAVPAVQALRRLTELFEQSQQLPRLAPTTAIYLAVSKAIFNEKDDGAWNDRMGKSRVATIDSLCRECIVYAREHPDLLQTNTALYNVALDSWSKALPPSPSKRSTAAAVVDFVNDTQLRRQNNVAMRVTDLFAMFQEDGLQPTAKTYTSMIYAYTKAGKLEEAYAMMESLLEHLAKASTHKLERVDSRALRALANALARQMDRPVTPALDVVADAAATNDDDTRKRTAERIERIIAALWELDAAGYDDVAPDVFLYTTAVDAWANAQCDESLLRAQTLVDDITARHEKDTATPRRRHGSLKPDIALYNALIKAIAKQPNLVDAADKAGSVVRSLVEGKQIRPDVFTYNALIEACVSSPNDISKAEETLDRMTQIDNPRPNESTFLSVIYALLTVPGGTARAERMLDRMEERYLPRGSLYESVISSWCDEPAMATRAQQLLERMEELFKAQNKKESLRPNRALYNAVIQALEDQGEASAAEAVKEKRDNVYGSGISSQKLRSNSQVFALLQEVDANLAGNTAPSGNTYNFNQVLAQLAYSGKIWSGLRAEDVLNYMLELTFKRKNRDATPNIVSFNTVISAWAKSNHALAGEKAAEVMKKLDDLHDMGLLEDVVADRITYNTLMNAYAKSYDTEDAGDKAQECFDKLLGLYEKTRDEQYKPDVVSYATLLGAWARSNQYGAAKKAEDILQKMHADYTADPSNPKPTTICFNEVLYAWARSGQVNSAKRAEMVLRLMEDLTESGKSDVVPDTRTYNIVLLALANSPRADSPIRAMQLLDDMKALQVGPDAVSYNTAITAFTKKKSVGAAMEMLEEMFARKDVILDSKFFSSLLNSIAETETAEAPVLARGIIDDLLRREEHPVEVTTEICNGLINCWGRNDSLDAPLRADAVLDDMLSGKLPASPDVVTFTMVIDIWAKSGDPDAPMKAEAVLKKMVNVAPNVQTYTAMIQVYARGHRRDKAKRAQEVLMRMKQDYLNGNDDAKPSIFTYNAVLNAAEFTVGNEVDLEEAFQVACETFDEVRLSEILTPDHVTYGSFMGVISQLMPKSDIRNDMVQLVFRRCCKDGQLAPVVMKKFREAADGAQYKALMSGNSKSSLPNEWTFNVRGARQ